MSTPYERTQNALRNWVGKEIQVDGIRWRVLEVGDPDPYTASSRVRFERIYEKARHAPPIPRDPEVPLRDHY